MRVERERQQKLLSDLSKADKRLTEQTKVSSRLADLLALVEQCISRRVPTCTASRSDRSAAALTAYLRMGVCRLSSTTTPLTFEFVTSVFEALNSQFFEEYVMYSLSAMAPPLILPLLKRELSGWSPLAEPRRGLDSYRRWRALLHTDAAAKAEAEWGAPSQADSAHYCRLLREAWLPPIRNALLRWEPRAGQHVAELITLWQPVLPGEVQRELLETVVLPRLQAAIEAWNPRVETVAIHEWLHGWVPMLADRLQPSYASIRYKLSVALQEWHPSDASAHAILAPWRGVFDAPSMESILNRLIVPKLALALRAFVVNPAHQQLEPLLWLLRWVDVLPIDHTVGMLEAEFFPKWHAVLRHWLSSSPNYDEISAWYASWKAQFPAQLHADVRMQAQWNLALDAMNVAVSGGSVSNMPSAAPLHQPQHPIESATKPISRWEMEEKMSFKEIVAQYAEEECAVIFMPKGKLHDGKPVFAFGKLTVYIDGKSIFLQEAGAWRPVSLSDLKLACHGK
jgi:tuftelin-interacting protein 11